MVIFPEEKSLIGENSNKSEICCKVSLCEDKSELLIKSLEWINKSTDRRFAEALAKVSEEGHPDLMYGSAILVSTNMNLNDDVLLPSETWPAIATAVNVPYNDDHVKTDIIGHIIGARPLDAKGNLIVSETPPDYFDVEADFVIYRRIFPAIAKDIEEKAPKGEKFVSMEAAFDDFDYALVKDTEAKIIKRTKDTAFLTKHLRAYKGDGKYNGYTVGRVLRDYRFIGMGSVDKPANPNSKYTKIEEVDLVTQASLLKRKYFLFTKGKVMKIETIEQAETVVAELSTKLEKYEKTDVPALAAQVSELTKAKDTVASELESEKVKVQAAVNKFNDTETKNATLTEELKVIKASLEKVTAELSAIQAEAKTNERIAKLAEFGVEIAADKRDGITKMSDEAFNSTLEFTESVFKKFKKDKETKKDEKDPKDEKDTKATDLATDKADETKAAKETADENALGKGDIGTDSLKETAAGLIAALRKPKDTKKVAK